MKQIFTNKRQTKGLLKPEILYKRAMFRRRPVNKAFAIDFRNRKSYDPPVSVVERILDYALYFDLQPRPIGISPVSFSN
ncbi:MAG TPA: hypothetical protein DCM62_09060 [Bacteroidales bacterium]|nr:hypothetical protein [Bacteroidales bacterium]